MKNIAGKTLIFYTFQVKMSSIQQKKELEYNVIAYQQTQQPVSSPIDLDSY
jgi:hypothetical protein